MFSLTYFLPDLTSLQKLLRAPRAQVIRSCLDILNSHSPLSSLPPSSQPPPDSQDDNNTSVSEPDSDSDKEQECHAVETPSKAEEDPPEEKEDKVVSLFRKTFLEKSVS